MKNNPSRIFHVLTVVCSLIIIISLLSSCKTAAPSKSENYSPTSGMDKVWEQEFLMTRDPRTRSIPPRQLLAAKVTTENAKEAARAARIQALNWTERGPNSDTLGQSNSNSRGPTWSVTSGRIKAVLIDSLDPTKRTVFVGTASGGLWKTTNITASPANWVLVNDFLNNLIISGLAQDPRPGSQNIMYMCTGEIASGGQGVGVFKSTDGGSNWTYLNSTSNNNFIYCNRILCDRFGNVYVATIGGLYRSKDGGTSWTNIGPLTNNVCDIELASEPTSQTFHLVYGGNGDAQSYYFTSIPHDANSGAGWFQPSSSFVLSSTRKADLTVKGDTIYAIPSNNSGIVTNVYKSVDGGFNWSTTGALPTVTGGRNFAGNQGWYALMARVNPANANECIIGGLDCLRTTNGGATWTQISAWITANQDNYMHADHHEMQWWDNGTKILFANDGGVYYSSDKGTTIRDRNVGLRIKQFYSAESHPTTTNYFIGGTQDNGNHLVNTSSVGRSIELVGGDGAYVAIDQNEPAFQFVAYTQNQFRASADGGATWRWYNIDTTNGFFINPFDYDNQTNRLYSSHIAGAYYRWDNPQVAANLAGVSGAVVNVTGTNGFGSQRASAIHVSPYTANRVFFGLHQGDVRRVSNAHLSTPTAASITPPGMSGSNAFVQCVTTGSTESNLMVIYSNYGINNIWVSSNGGTNWVACDGNLPDMPVRWGIFHPDTDGMAIIATETGVWETELLDGANTVWTPSPGFPNVRVDMLHYRALDRRIIAATFGRGLWSTVVPVTRPSFSFDNPDPSVVPCPAPLGMTVRLGTNPGGGWGGNISLSASGVPSGAVISYSANPVAAGDTTDVRLIGANSLAPGIYRITITGTGTGVATQTRQITYEITSSPLEITRHPDDKTICAGSTASFNVTATGGGLSYQWQKSTNDGASWTDITGATVSVFITSTQLTTNSGDTYRCKVFSSCTNETKYTRAAKITVSPLPVTAITPASSTLCAGDIQRLIIAPNTIAGSATYVNNIAKDIPDNNLAGVTNTITVGGLPSGAVITGIRVSMNLIHTYVGDLVVNLRAPNGQTINLVNRLNNGTGTNNTDNFISTVFDSTFSTSLSAGAAPRTGNFRADKAQTTTPVFVPTTTTYWRPLFNSNPTGDWVLAVADRNALESGVLTYWSLVISYSYPIRGTWSASPTATGTMFLDASGANPYASSQEDTIYVKPTVNTTYSVALATNVCAATPTSASVSVGLPVTNATSSPSTVTVCSGSSFTLTAGHSTVPSTNLSPSYQWQLYVYAPGGPVWTNITGANGSTYTVNAATSSQNGNRYRCLITSECGAVATNYSTITVNPGTAITTQPVSQNFCDGGNASFSVTATGINLTYQWQRSTNNGSTWADISGATSSSVTVTSITAAQNGYQYRCVVSGGCAPASVTSAAAILTVVNTAAISQQPLSQTVCPGGDASFILVTNATLNYQWQASTNGGATWSNITGATSSTLTIASVNLGQSGYQYRCAATGNCGSITSGAATLTVSAITAITTQPTSNLTACSGGSATLSIVASGATSYQWQVSTDAGSQWNSISGATTASYTITSINATQSGNQYRCMVTGPCTTITSNVSGLIVSAATSISRQPGSQSVCPGGNASFSVTAAGTNLSYQWQVSADDGLSWTSIGGATSASLVISSVTASQNNYKYRCIVTGSCSPLIVTSVAATLTIVNSIIITEQPLSSTACIGASASFNCSASGASAYQWQLSTNNGGSWTAIIGATGQTLTIAPITLSLNGNLYRCVASSNCGLVTSTNVTLTVSAGETILLEPSSQTSCVGGNATFTLQASGTNLSYQWQLSTNAGANWTSINGATNTSYTVSSVTNAQSGNQYRCLITGLCGTITSAVASLTVSESVTISQQPSSQSVCQGSPAEFTIEAAGTNLTYQWQVSANGGNSWTDLSGEDGVSLTISSALASQSGYQYRCLVTSSCTTVTSNSTTLIVNGITSISLQPVDQNVCENNSSSFAVVASGVNLTYQWQESTNAAISWSSLSGATSSSYTVPSTSLSQSGNQYRCIIDGGCGREISSAATLTVSPTLAITQQPSAQTVCQGSAVNYTITAAGTNLSYQWEISTDGGTVWSSINGATSNSYQIATASSSQTGYRYRCVVSGSCGTLTSSAVSLSINTSTEILLQPLSQSVCDGATVSFTISAAGTNIAYQWEKSQAGFGNVWNTINGATSATYTISSALAVETGTQYRCLVTGECGVAASNEAELTINPITRVIQNPVSATVCEGGTITFSVIAESLNTSFQWQVSTNGGSTWSAINGATSADYTIAVVGATQDGNKYRCFVSGTCGSATSTPATLSVNQATRITTQPTSQSVCQGANSNNFTVSATGTNLIYQWQVSIDGGSNWNNIANATANIFSVTNATSPQSGNQYRCVISGTCGNATSTAVTLTVNPTTSIAAQTGSQTICQGANASFTVSANGVNFTYQWQVSADGGGTWSNISGAITSIYTVTAAIPSQSGNQFRCVVSGSCGTVNSSPATLTVNRSTVINQQPAGQRVCLNGNAVFTINADGLNIAYQWQISTNGGSNWTDIAGASNNSYTVSSVTNSQNGYLYRCIVTGICGAVTSNSAQLTVNPVTAIVQQPVSTTICLGSNATFITSAVGASLTYQWQVSANGGASWTSISGATNATYILIAPTLAMSGNQFRCVVNSDCGSVVNLTPAILTVHAPPVITTQPVNAEVCVGNAAVFTITASSVPAMQFQWQISTNNGNSWNTLSGATTTTLNVPSVIMAMNGNQYRCLVSNSTCASPVASAAAVLTTRLLPSVSLAAAPYTSLLPGQTTVLTATSGPGTGGAISYAWTLNGQSITPTSSSAHTVNVEGLGAYQVMVRERWTSGLLCSALSQTVIIGTEASSRLFIFPSPNNGVFTVSYYYNGNSSGSRQLHIYDNKGSILYKRTFTVTGPYTLMPVNMEAAARGIYRIVIGDAAGNKLVDGNMLIH